VKNVTEMLVVRSYEDLLRTRPDCCRCEVCREDVLVFALNRLPPHYTSTLQGEVVSKLEMEAGQGSIDVTVVLLEGMQRVAASPRCGRAARTGP
jgi:competence protein ComFB